MRVVFFFSLFRSGRVCYKPSTVRTAYKIEVALPGSWESNSREARANTSLGLPSLLLQGTEQSQGHERDFGTCPGLFAAAERWSIFEMAFVVLFTSSSLFYGHAKNGEFWCN